MKKLILFLLVGLMLLSLAACGKSDSQNTEQNATQTAEQATQEIAVSGGWTDASSPEVPDTVKELFVKINQESDVEYTPVAYLSSQIVAGTNHRLLCIRKPDDSDTATYAIVEVYENLEGEAAVTSVMNSTAVAPVEGLMGGWTTPDSPVPTDEAKTALEEAGKLVYGVSYAPVALVGTQVVAGTNYKILCKATPDGANQSSYDALLVVYADLEGNDVITEDYQFNENVTPTDSSIYYSYQDSE